MKNETEKFELACAETSAVLIGTEGENNIPNVIRLMPVGEIVGRDGRRFYLNDPDAVIEQTLAYKKNTDLLIDYNHQSEYSEQNGRPAPAAGWMTDFFTADGHLCAAVQWTDKAEDHIKKREFRYISPVFYHTDGNIRCIVSAALTNTPNFDLKALNQTKEIKMDKEKALCQALDAPDEDKALLRISELKAAQKELNDIAAALNCEAKAEAIVKAINETKADPAKFVEIDKVTELTRELNEIKAERAEEKAENAVNAAIRDGRLPPVLKENAKEICKKMGETALNEFVSKMPKVSAPSSAAGEPPKPACDALSEDEKEICEIMGISSETFKKGK